MSCLKAHKKAQRHRGTEAQSEGVPYNFVPLPFCVLAPLCLCAFVSFLAPLLLNTPVAAGMFPPHVFTDDARGTTSAPFLKSPASARLSALGFGGAALMAPDAFFLNPAGAAYLPQGASSVLLGYESLLEGSGRTAIAGLKGLARGTVGLGALYRYDTDLKRYDIYGEAGGGFEAYDAAFIGSYGARFPHIDAGLAVKYIRSKLDTRSAGAAALDLGMIIKGSESSGTDLAFFIRNFGAPQKLGSEPAPLPFELGGGLNWRLVPRLNFFIDARLPADHSPYLIIAGEYGIPFTAPPKAPAEKPGDGPVRSGLFLRGGMNFKNKEDLGLMGAFSAGFGIKFGKTGFDYAFVPYGDLGVTHRLTLGRGFGSGAAAAPAGGADAAKVPARTEKLSLAVAAFDPGDGVPESLARQVSDLLEAELIKTGAFTLVERTKLDFILAEKKIDYAGLSSKEGAAGLAQLVGAKAALFGAVSKDEKGYIIAVKLVNAETGEILAAENKTVKEDHLFKQAARELAASLALTASITIPAR